MNKAELEAFAREAAKTIKTEKDLNAFSQMLAKITVEAALNAELDAHLGYGKHQHSDTENCRNGFSSKTLKTEDGQFEVSIPRDRGSSLEPQLVSKHQTRFTSLDDKILSLYAKGMTTREIVAAFKELYGAEVSATLISKVTDAVIAQVVEWQSRPPDAVYPTLCLDCIVVKIRQDKQVINKACPERSRRGHLPGLRGEHGRPQGAAGLMAV
jgi:putative transposase